MRIAGISVRAGDIYMAAVSAPSCDRRIADVVAEATDRLSFSENLEGAVQLLELKERVRQNLREWDVATVGVLGTNQHTNWKYSSAATRVLAISTVMFASAEEDINFSLQKPGPVAKLAVSPKLDSIDESLFGLETRPTYWNAGLGQAYTVAAFMLSHH